MKKNYIKEKWYIICLVIIAFILCFNLFYDLSFQNLTVGTKASIANIDKQYINKLQVLGTSDFDISKSVYVGKPAVKQIFNRTCLVVKFITSKLLPRTSGKTYTLCSASLGSGFFVNKDGYLLTNTHVAKPNPLDALVERYIIDTENLTVDNAASKSKLWADLEYDIDKQFTALKQTPTEDEFMMAIVLTLVKFNRERTYNLVPVYENYVQNGTAFIYDAANLSLKNLSSQLKADIEWSYDIDSSMNDYYEQYYKISTGIGLKIPDIAVLKIDKINNKDFISLKLANYKSINDGEKVTVIGYPSAAFNSQLLSTESSTIASITNGSVSAVKTSSAGNFKLVQIDASIEHVSSGGPILNQNGEVIAITTYIITPGQTTGNFNLGVSVEEIQKVLNSNNILNVTVGYENYIKEALDSISTSYYSKAKKQIELTLDKYPSSNEVISPLLSYVNDQIDLGKDESPLITIQGINIMPIHIILSIGILITLGIIIFLFGRVSYLKHRLSEEENPFKNDTPTSKFF